LHAEDASLLQVENVPAHPKTAATCSGPTATLITSDVPSSTDAAQTNTPVVDDEDDDHDSEHGARTAGA
jgi:hypothetical protein